MEFSFDDSGSDWHSGAGGEGYADMTGFRDPGVSFDYTGGSDLGLGNYSFDYQNPYMDMYAPSYASDGSQIYDNTGSLGEYGSNQWDQMDADGSAGGWWDTAAKYGGKALGWLGQGNNARDLLGTGLGALSMYGNYQAGKAGQQMSDDELALRRELGLGQLGIADRGMGLQENQFRLDNGIDDMASKALGMQLLVNRGRMSQEQTNPWLNFMFTGREQMFGQDPVIGNAFKTNPFGGSPVGAAIGPAFGNIDSIAQANLPLRIGSNALTPEFQQSTFKAPRQMAQGGLAALGYLAGGSTGQADDVNANLSHGEYVFDADVVAALGDGNSEAGARKLDEMRENIRRHKRGASVKDIPPPAKSPLAYMGGK